jgi:hypothetical protein
MQRTECAISHHIKYEDLMVVLRATGEKVDTIVTARQEAVTYSEQLCHPLARKLHQREGPSWLQRKPGN